MSEDKRTPGPFFQDGDMICDRRRSEKPGRERWIAMLEDADTITDEEAQEVVDLLNKGTHYDGMLKAMKEAAIYAGDDVNTRDILEDAIAAAEGSDA